MSNNNTLKPVAAILGAALVGSLSTTSLSAAENPFGATQLDSGYMQLASNHEGSGDGDKAESGKCGGGMKKEGKCGGDMKKEGKCGEGKCGGKMKKEGKCGGDNKKKEGKCGEGKCGGDKG